MPNFFYVSNDQYYFKEHTIVHKRDGLRKCSECDKSFTNTYLKKHMLIHGGIEPVNCELCPYITYKPERAHGETQPK